MSTRHQLLYLTALLGLVSLAACSTNLTNTPTPAGGVLSGTIQLWDDKTSTLADNSGVIITVDDLTGVSTITDAAGKYSLANITYGLHDLTMSKAGYGTFRLFGVSTTSSINGTILPATQLGKLATTTVTSLTLSGSAYNGSSGVSVLYSVAPIPTAINRGYVRYFLSTDPAVSSTNYTFTSPIVSVLNNNVTGGFTKEDLLTAGFKSGQTVYLRLYGESVQSNTYVDPNVGTRVFPNLNLTTVEAVSFVLP
ncbi:hypothetical protein [Spirosoma pollinicola]|uniref:Carboxypeptidase regulatory-like domain-containing protein n=1 Tax=Spirosoma pollinicola TaxID=2057025 RepID=A0A2K8ZAQ2_9BACT|nr:hypothetical protein [Spirosoma pollinicola]AUD06935.1 hypothetical protein CWM47_36910 [Spirosoma pollinicola]